MKAKYPDPMQMDKTLLNKATSNNQNFVPLRGFTVCTCMEQFNPALCYLHVQCGVCSDSVTVFVQS